MADILKKRSIPMPYADNVCNALTDCIEPEATPLTFCNLQIGIQIKRHMQDGVAFGEFFDEHAVDCFVTGDIQADADFVVVVFERLQIGIHYRIAVMPQHSGECLFCVPIG